MRHPNSISFSPATLHARPGLCRQGVRLPAAQGDLRPVVRAGDARHPLLHRLPETDRPSLRGRRRRRDRLGEGRRAARVRGRGDADRASRPARPAGVRARGLDPLGAARVRRRIRPGGRVHGDRCDRRHGRQHPRVGGRRAPRDARQRRRRAAAVQLHPAGDRAYRAAAIAISTAGASPASPSA